MRLCYFKTDFPSEVTVINVVKKFQPQQMFACFFFTNFAVRFEDLDAKITFTV